MPFPVDNIRRYCEANGLTIAELERELGIGNGVIRRWEFAKTSPPIDRLVAIAIRLGVSLDDLSREKESPAPEEQPQGRTKINPNYYNLSPEDRAVVDALIDRLSKAGQ